LKVIFAKPFPAIPATLLGALGTAACAGTGISATKSPAKREYMSHREICGRVGRTSFTSIRKYLFYECRLRGINFRRGVILIKQLWVIEGNDHPKITPWLFLGKFREITKSFVTIL
jgi:hypothetical protein